MRRGGRAKEGINQRNARFWIGQIAASNANSSCLAQIVRSDSELTTGVAIDLDKTNLQHHLLRRGNSGRVNDAAGRIGPCNLYCAINRRRVDCRPFEDHLVTTAPDPDAASARPSGKFLSDAPCVRADFNIHYANDAFRIVENRNIRRAGLFAENVEALVAQRNDICNFRGADENVGKGIFETKCLGFIHGNPDSE